VALEFAGEHGAAGEADRGQVAGGSPHQEGWRGLVATHEQNGAIDWVAADGFFHVHAGQVAEEHSRGPQHGFTQRHHGEFQGKATRLPNSALHIFGKLAKVSIAWGQF